MITTNMVCQNQKLDWEPSPIKIQELENLVKDGKNLPNSVTEDIHGFSLRPWYSEKQIRKINQWQRNRRKTSQKINRTRDSKRKTQTKYELMRQEYIDGGVF